MTNDRWEPVPIPQGDGRHDIGDDVRAAIVQRLISDWSHDPDLTAEKARQLAMWAAASARVLLHELGTLRDLTTCPPARSVAQEAEILCVCGHPMDLHGNDGAGHCGASRSCRAGGCKKFRLKGGPEPATPPPALLAQQEQLRCARQFTETCGLLCGHDGEHLQASAVRQVESLRATIDLLQTFNQRHQAALLALVSKWENTALAMPIPRMEYDRLRLRMCAQELKAELEKRT